jgi:hypothetical protein
MASIRGGLLQVKSCSTDNHALLLENDPGGGMARKKDLPPEIKNHHQSRRSAVSFPVIITRAVSLCVHRNSETEGDADMYWPPQI